MRISDWSSDVCSSDLHADAGADQRGIAGAVGIVRRAGLAGVCGAAAQQQAAGKCGRDRSSGGRSHGNSSSFGSNVNGEAKAKHAAVAAGRSEEHTSDPPVTNAHIVCSHLLEKIQKKKIY